MLSRSQWPATLGRRLPDLLFLPQYRRGMAVLGGGVGCVLALCGRMGYGCAAEQPTRAAGPGDGVCATLSR